MDRTCNWSRIIGLDLSKATFKGCILSGEGFVKRQSFNGEMSKDESGYRLINQTIQAGDIVLMEAGSATFNLARYLVKESKASDVVVLNPANLRIIWDSCFYNNERPKESLGGLSPVEFRLQNPKGTYPMVIK